VWHNRWVWCDNDGSVAAAAGTDEIAAESMSSSSKVDAWQQEQQAQCAAAPLLAAEMMMAEMMAGEASVESGMTAPAAYFVAAAAAVIVASKITLSTMIRHPEAKAWCAAAPLLAAEMMMAEMKAGPGEAFVELGMTVPAAYFVAAAAAVIVANKLLSVQWLGIPKQWHNAQQHRW
jgi:hypothetical protein